MRIGQQRNGSRRHRRKQRPGQQRLARRLQHARGVDQPSALAAELFRQVNGVKAVGDQRIPPSGSLPAASASKLSRVAAIGACRPANCADGVAEILLLRGQSQRHDRGRDVANAGFGRTDCYPSVLQDEPSRLVADYGAGQDM